jgi:hypothetical protein
MSYSILSKAFFSEEETLSEMLSEFGMLSRKTQFNPSAIAAESQRRADVLLERTLSDIDKHCEKSTSVIATKLVAYLKKLDKEPIQVVQRTEPVHSRLAYPERVPSNKSECHSGEASTSSQKTDSYSDKVKTPYAAKDVETQNTETPTSEKPKPKKKRNRSRSTKLKSAARLKSFIERKKSSIQDTEIGIGTDEEMIYEDAESDEDEDVVTDWTAEPKKDPEPVISKEKQERLKRIPSLRDHGWNLVEVKVPTSQTMKTLYDSGLISKRADPTADADHRKRIHCLHVAGCGICSEVAVRLPAEKLSDSDRLKLVKELMMAHVFEFKNVRGTFAEFRAFTLSIHDDFRDGKEFNVYSAEAFAKAHSL